MTSYADMLNSRPAHRLAVTRERAFTLIEVLVVVAIIALLISILLPSLAAAREVTKSTVCLSQLRQMAVAATSYTNSYGSSYPIAFYRENILGTDNYGTIFYAWDFTHRDLSGSPATVRPGLLWQGLNVSKIHSCPSFDGKENSDGDPYSGYNYNTSYVGTYKRVKGVVITKPARQDEIRRPDRCAVFGDGQYWDGLRLIANKFMRSPWGPARDNEDGSLRAAGTQGYRHLKKTNVSFADAHAESRGQRYNETYEAYRETIPRECGFLSASNDIYSLDGKTPPPRAVTSN